jgi:hypothetical protein
MVNLLDSNNYWAYWYGVRKSHPTDKDAWEEVENEMISNYGSGMYESYEAFRTAKHRYRHSILDKAESGEITRATIADAITIPGYMAGYDNYREQQFYNDSAILTDEKIWNAYNKAMYDMYGLMLYTTYSAFRTARLRYIQSIRKRKMTGYKTKVKSSK